MNSLTPPQFTNNRIVIENIADIHDNTTWHKVIENSTNIHDRKVIEKDTDIHDDDSTVKHSNKTEMKVKIKHIRPTAMALRTKAKALTLALANHVNNMEQRQQSNIQIPGDHAIADSGATAHFLLTNAPVTSVKIAREPLRINLPDGVQVRSSHTYRLNIAGFPATATEAHIVLQLAHTSLISIKALCDAGCITSFTNNEVHIYYRNKIVWMGHHEASTGLWILPLTMEKTTPK